MGPLRQCPGVRIVCILSAVLLALAGACGPNGGGESVRPAPPICDPECDAAAHQECVRGEDAPECECVAGYEGAPCAWAGAPEDPEFTDPGAWTDRSPGTAIRPAESGLGPGVGVLESSVLCGGGTINQLITMPDYEVADPFVAELTYRTMDSLGPDVYYERAVKTLPASQVWVTERFCLGEAAYGGPVLFRIGPQERFDECSPNPVGSIELDRFEILVAGPEECPAPSTAVNGAAELDGAEWFSIVEQALGAGLVTASLEPGAGAGGSSGAHLYVERRDGNRGAMGTKVSIGLRGEDSAPALRFWWRATPGSVFLAELGEIGSIRVGKDVLDTLRGDGTAQRYSYCLPPWMHGNSLDLTFSFAGNLTEGEQVLDVDDVEVYADPACANSIDFTDPGFDAVAHRRPGTVISISSLESPVQVINDPGLSAGSPGLLEISYSSNQDSIRLLEKFWVPPSSGEKGPAIVFRSNIPPDAGIDVAAVLGVKSSEASVTDVREGIEWRDNWLCAPPQWAGRWFRFGIRVARLGGADEPESFDPPRRILFDDFQVTTLGQCPVD